MFALLTAPHPSVALVPVTEVADKPAGAVHGAVVVNESKALYMLLPLAHTVCTSK